MDDVKRTAVLKGCSNLLLVDVEFPLKLADECLHIFGDIGYDIDVASCPARNMDGTMPEPPSLRNFRRSNTQQAQ